MNKLEISEVCRCCLSQPMNLHDLFNPDNGIDIVTAIQDICGINLYSNSSLPDKICDECLECVKASNSFRIRTQQSDKTLHSILKGSIIVKECIAEEIGQSEENEQNQTDSVEFEEDFQNDEDVNDNDNTNQELAITFDSNTNSIVDLQCPYCHKNFVHRRNLRTHIQRHFAVGKYTCPHCANRYHTKFDLNRHMIKTHSDGVSFNCGLCDKEFPTKPEWNRHLRTHNEQKPFSCSVCGMQFKLKHNAQQHINSHDNRKPFICDICGKGFAFECKLKNHKKSKCQPSVHIGVLKEEEQL